jgi:predicted XRE-type DNA-binding protein
MIKVGNLEMGTMEDLTRDLTPQDRERIEAIKREMIDAERGYELAALRRAQGLTQAQVAETLGITQGRVSQMERGQTHLTTTTMAAYLEAIGGELTILATVGNISVRL